MAPEMNAFGIDVLANAIANGVFALLVLAYQLLRRRVDRSAPGYRPVIILVAGSLYVVLAFPLFFAARPVAAIGLATSTVAMFSLVLRELWSFWRLGIWGVDRGAAVGLGYSKTLALCHDSLEFLGIGAHKLTSEAEAFDAAVKRCNRSDRPMRFLLCRPDSPELQDMARQAGTDREQYQAHVRESLRHLKRLKFEHARHIEVRFYSQLPLFRLVFINNKLCIASHYIVGEGDGSRIPQLHVVHKTPLSREVESLYFTLRKYFEQLWKESTPWDFEQYL